jgi:hypothetical protein
MFEHTLGQLRRVDVYLQHSTALEQSGAHAVDLVCDSRSILIGFSDGTFQLLSWQSQVSLVLLPHNFQTAGFFRTDISLEENQSKASECPSGYPPRPNAVVVSLPV